MAELEGNVDRINLEGSVDRINLGGDVSMVLMEGWASSRVKAPPPIPYPPFGFKLVVDYEGSYILDYQGNYIYAKSE